MKFLVEGLLDEVLGWGEGDLLYEIVLLPEDWCVDLAFGVYYSIDLHEDFFLVRGLPGQRS